MKSSSILVFQDKIWKHYRKHKRAFAWRETRDTYKIAVSEIMLQQTQTACVEPKYAVFIARFPDWKTLAEAALVDVLKLWQGLGYNRRARYLHEMAKVVVGCHGGVLPDTYKELIDLPGIGDYTANALLAFGFNQPVVVLETNIRTVFVYEFFGNKKKVVDTELVPLIAETVDRENPREWYYALMDYGAFLKGQGVALNSRNPAYRKQSKFEGSNRQVRGKILRVLTNEGAQTFAKLVKKTESEKERVVRSLKALVKERLVDESKGTYVIT